MNAQATTRKVKSMLLFSPEKSKFTIILSILFALIILPGFTSGHSENAYVSEESGDSNTIHGVVTAGSVSGMGLSEVLVKAYQGDSLYQSTLTDAQGKYRLSLLPDGKYRLVFLKKGYRMKVWLRYKVKDNRSYKLDEVLQDSASIDPSGTRY